MTYDFIGNTSNIPLVSDMMWLIMVYPLLSQKVKTYIA